MSVAPISPKMKVKVRKESSPESPSTRQDSINTYIIPLEEKYVRTERQLEDYKAHSQIDHILEKPDMWMGSILQEDREDWIFNLETSKLMRATISIPRGMERLYLEVLGNAGDNADASRRFGVNPGSIDVSMDRQWVSVRNGGEPIPVEIHPTNGMWIPQMIFGTLFTSSNYDKKVVRMGGGTNGIGIKLCAIWSMQFIVRVGDPKRKREFVGYWKGNMKQEPEINITEGYTGESYVEVSYNMDFARMGYSEYPDEAICLFARYLIDFSLTCKVPVSFNGIPYDVRNIRDYCRLFWDDEVCRSAIIHYEWSGKTMPAELSKLQGVAREKAIAHATSPDCIPIVEMCCLDTPDNANYLSFVNGLITVDHGVHLDEAFKQISTQILDTINNTMNKPKPKRGKAKDEETKSAPHLTVQDLKPHVSMIVSVRLPDPSYNSQSKTRLAGPKPKITVDETVFKSLTKWNLVERLYASLEAKMYKTLAKTDGKKKRWITLDKGEDANAAGSSKSEQCVLYIVEGKSASSYPKYRISKSSGGKELNGYYPLRGKFLNTRNCDILQLAENQEIKDLKKMIGIQEGIDYREPENRKQLRYGFICVCTDADSDGKHILSLLLNFFERYPTVLACGMIGYLRTPVVRLFRGNQVAHRFYSLEAFESWREHASELEQRGLGRPKYYKGLGTSRDKDIIDDLTTAPTIICFYDEEAPANLQLAFHRDYADNRKEWIAKWRNATQVDDVIFHPVANAGELLKQQTISSFINRDLIEYTLDALMRAIPSMYSGLKKSQVQILYAALEYWNYGHSRKGEMKVGRLANFAAEKVHYHHGEGSLCETIIKMAHDFVGSNNMPYFRREGQLGTRDEGGADAAEPRYAETALEWWIPLVYEKQCVDLVPRRIVEDEEAEPEWLPATIPMHLVNGALGIATGYSTFIPQHNPLHLIRWLKMRCEGMEEPPELMPWYRNFTGQIQLVEPRSQELMRVSPLPLLKEGGLATPPAVAEEVEEVLEGEEPTEEGEKKRIKGPSMKTLGTYSVTGTDNNGKFNVTITELPIGRWMQPYRKWLEKLREEKKLNGFDDLSDTERPRYNLYGFAPGRAVNHETLLLKKSYGMGNMILIDHKGYPFHFKSCQEILQSYYKIMLDLYEQLRQKQLSEINDCLLDLNYRIKFITLILDETIVVFRQTKAFVAEQMEKYEIPFKYFEKIKLSNCTAEEIKELKDEIARKNLEYETISKTTAQRMWVERLNALETGLRKHGYLD